MEWKAQGSFNISMLKENTMDESTVSLFNVKNSQTWTEG